MIALAHNPQRARACHVVVGLIHQSSDRSEVVYWVVDPLVGHPLLDGLPALQSGFTEQPPISSTTLDFVKAPLFDFGLGRVLAPTGSGNGDDLQGLLSLYPDQCKAAEGEIFASVPSSPATSISLSISTLGIPTDCTACTTST